MRALCNQSGEYGPIAQVLAGVDVALWDIAAQKANQPLWRLLGGTSNRVPIYASGINPTDPKPIVERKINEGYKAFKLKIGFDPDLDHGNLDEIRKLIGPTKYLMADANQAWNLEEARRLIPSLAHTDLLWIEEPIPADATAKEWKELSVEYINWLKKNGVITKLYVAKALNHFTIVKSLSNPRSILTKKIFSMIDL